MTCTPRKVCHKIWAIIVVAVALGFGALVFLAMPLPPRMEGVYLPLLMRPLHGMLAILGIGALIKYLFTCSSCAYYCIGKEKGMSQSTETETK